MAESNVSRYRIAVLASGAGSNLTAIQRWIAEHLEPKIEIGLVLSNNSKSGAMAIAANAGIAAVHHSQYICGGDEALFARRMVAHFREREIDLIVLAGYMKQLPNSVVEQYRNRILNIHPALLPSFGGSQMFGMKVHEAVLARGCKVSGATVHLVTQEYDAGPIVLQKCCTVDPGETPASLAEKVRLIEHEILPQAIGLFAAGKVAIHENIASIQF